MFPVTACPHYPSSRRTQTERLSSGRETFYLTVTHHYRLLLLFSTIKERCLRKEVYLCPVWSFFSPQSRNLVYRPFVTFNWHALRDNISLLSCFQVQLLGLLAEWYSRYVAPWKYRVDKKFGTLFVRLKLHQILTSFKLFFTVRIRTYVITLSLKIPHT